MRCLMPIFSIILTGVTVCTNAVADTVTNTYTSDIRTVINARDHWYTLKLPLTRPVTDGARLTHIAWRYDFGQLPPGAGITVFLCRDGKMQCYNISRLSSGSTQTFTGLPAQQPFVLYYRLNTIYRDFEPPQGQAQITVNWQ